MPITIHPSPTAPTVTPNGSGGTYASNYIYCIVAIFSDGSRTVSPTTFQTGCPTNPDASHFNTLVWTSTPGAIGTDIYRCFSNSVKNQPQDAGKIGHVTGNSFQDIGQSADGSLAPNNGIPITITAIPNSTHVTVTNTAFANTYLLGCSIGNPGQAPTLPAITGMTDALHLIVDNAGLGTPPLTTGAAVIATTSGTLVPQEQAISYGVFADTQDSSDVGLRISAIKANVDTSNMSEGFVLTTKIGKSDSTTMTDAALLQPGLNEPLTITMTDNTLTSFVKKVFAEVQNLFESFNIIQNGVDHTADLTTMADASSISTIKPLPETETMVEGFSNEILKTFPETITDTEAFSKQINKNLNESIQPIDDGIAFSIHKSYPENIVVGDWISIKLFKENQWGG